MRYKDEEAFSKAHKAGELGDVIMLCGAEEYLVDAWKNKLSAPFADSGAFNLQRLEGRGLDMDALCDAAEALPLFAEKKCVVVEDLEASKLSPADMDKLSALLSDPSPDCLLIITGKSAFDPKSANGKKIVALAEKYGSVAELGARGQQGLVAFVKGIAKRNGCTISTELARRVLAELDADMNNLRCEMEKICACANYGEITAQHISDVTTPKTEARVFDLSRAITSNQPGRAMAILSDLFQLREQPVAILSTLIMSYVDLYRARAAKDAGVILPDAAERMGYKGREFRLRNAYGSRLSAGALRASLDALYDCDRRLKSTGIDDRVLLEQTVVKLFRAGAMR